MLHSSEGRRRRERNGTRLLSNLNEIERGYAGAMNVLQENRDPEYFKDGFNILPNCVVHRCEEGTAVVWGRNVRARLK